MSLRDVLVLSSCALISASIFAADKKAPSKAGSKPKYDIEEIMKKGMKKGTLLDKLKQHDASKEEIAQLMEYCKVLMENDPPKGDKASWQKRTKALYEAVVEVGKGNHKAMDALSSASNCKNCHNVHKPD